MGMLGRGFPSTPLVDIVLFELPLEGRVFKMHLIERDCTSPPLVDISSLGFPFQAPLKVFKTRLLGRGFHTLIKNDSFPSPTDMGSHNPPPFKAQPPL